jgi:hypothetical protein
MSQNRNLDSSLLTKVKGSRTVFANNLTQNAVVNAGRRLAVTGVANTDNGFTVAINTGSVNLTPAEYEAAIQFGSAAAAAAAPQRILFASSNAPGGFSLAPLPSGYIVPAGYTGIRFLLIGRGGQGYNYDNGGGGGGGAGQIVVGSLPVSAGNPISIEYTTGSNAGIQITISGESIAAYNGGDATAHTAIGGESISIGGPPGNNISLPVTVSGFAGGSGGNGNTFQGRSGDGGAISSTTILPPLPPDFPFGGGGGGGSPDNIAMGKNGGGNGQNENGGAGGPSFYAIQLTPAGYTGPNLFSL